MGLRRLPRGDLVHLVPGDALRHPLRPRLDIRTDMQGRAARCDGRLRFRGIPFRHACQRRERVGVSGSDPHAGGQPGDAGHTVYDKHQICLQEAPAGGEGHVRHRGGSLGLERRLWWGKFWLVEAQVYMSRGD